MFRISKESLAAMDEYQESFRKYSWRRRFHLPRCVTRSESGKFQVDASSMMSGHEDFPEFDCPIEAHYAWRNKEHAICSSIERELEDDQGFARGRRPGYEAAHNRGRYLDTGLETPILPGGDEKLLSISVYYWGDIMPCDMILAPDIEAAKFLISDYKWWLLQEPCEMLVEVTRVRDFYRIMRVA